MKINIGTPRKDGNVYFIENDSSYEDGKEFIAFRFNNINTEKVRNQKFIWKKGHREDKNSVSKNNLKSKSQIMPYKKDSKPAQNKKVGESFVIENVKLKKAKEIKLQATNSKSQPYEL